MKKLIIANWKMNGSLQLIKEFAFATRDASSISVDAVLCPPTPYLHAAADEGSLLPVLGAQDCAGTSDGAYTGEVSARMLKDFGVFYCLIGHSERRQNQAETNTMLTAKIQQLDAHSIIPVFCVGETQTQRDDGTWQDVLKGQLSILASRDKTSIIVAYEPVWAIGTGRVPTASDIEDAHCYIRGQLADLGYADGHTRILYGGSAKADNAARLLSLTSVDGLLVGGASLDPAQFSQIMETAADTNWGALRA